jgi:colanic acid biosynthesis glycosyl transferase WcaI
MKILILSQEYAPEEISSAILSQELAEDLVKRGHKVTCVTRVPNYPLGIVFPGYKNMLFQQEDLNFVKVIRVWSFINSKKGFWHRALSFGSYSLLAFFGGLFAGKPDLIVSYSPPLPLGLSAWLLSVLWHIPWLLRVEDVFPEAAVAAGVMKNRMAIRVFDNLAGFLYDRANHISLICNAFARLLIARGVDNQKISITPVWADPDIVVPESKNNQFREKFGLDNKFVLMYAGILGHTSALEDIANAALFLKENNTINFVVVGEGVKKDWLVQYKKEHKLENLILLPFQPRTGFPEMLAAADVGLVTLNEKMAQYSLPHKIFNIMASQRPVLAVAPARSDLAELIVLGNFGIVVPPQKPALLVNAILEMQTQPTRLQILGENGRRLLISSYSRQKCVSDYERIFYLTIGNKYHE